MFPATPTSPEIGPARRRPGPEAVLWLAVGGLWAVLVPRLASAWSASLEQAHGWAVPLLCAWLAWERRATAPAPSAGGGAAATALSLAGALALAAALPVLEANRLWPLAQWAAAAGAATASFGLLAAAGGWRWARHFLFPLFFATTALTWPAAVQEPLLRGLAGFNAALAAEAVSLLGHPAVVRGNLIEIAAGVVGVDEACAGLRSLQAVWMLAWFGGELLRLSAARRVALVGAGLAAAFAGNVLRTVFLTLRVAADGAGGGERWHDTAGHAAMAGTFAAVGLAAWWLARGAARGPARPAPAYRLPASWRAGGLAVVALLVVAEAGTRLWFGGRTEAGTSQWRLRSGVPGWAPLPIAPRIHEALGYSSAEAFSWSDGARAAVAYVIRWEEPGQLGFAHDLTVCLPALGAVLEGELAPESLDVGGRAVAFDAYRFAGAGTTQHLFVCLWDAFHGRAVRGQADDFLPAHRLERVREGRGRADTAQVIFVLQGEPGDAAARAWLRGAVAELLRAR